MWLSVAPSTANGTELGVQEWRDAVFLQYGIEPLESPRHCDGCGFGFSISHVLDCKKGSLVMSCHNELRDRVADLASKAHTRA